MRLMIVLVNFRVDIYILGNERGNRLLVTFLVLSMTFIDHVSRPHSEKRIYTDSETDSTRSHNTLPII